MSEVLCNFWPLFWALLAISRASGKKNSTELPVHHCDSIIETSGEGKFRNDEWRPAVPSLWA